MGGGGGVCEQGEEKSVSEGTEGGGGRGRKGFTGRRRAVEGLSERREGGHSVGECPMRVCVSVSVYVHARECFLARVFVSVQEGKEAKKDEDVEKAEGKAVQSLFFAACCCCSLRESP